MTNAIISGRLGIAVVGDTSARHVIWRDKLAEQVVVEPDVALSLLREATDPEYKSGLDEAEIREQLELASDSSSALDLVLFLLDRNLSDETRECAASELDELLLNTGVANRVEDLLYAKPLSVTADIEGATRIAEPHSNASALLASLWESQTAIATVRTAWDAMPLDEGKRTAFESAFLAHGVFRAFSKSLATGTNINEVVVQFGLNTALKDELPNVAHVLTTWRQQMPAHADTWVLPLL